MLALKMILTLAGWMLLTTAFGLPLYALWLRMQNARRKPAENEIVTASEPEPIAWHLPLGLALAGCVPLLIAASIVVVPSGTGGVRISQVGGTLPGTLYPGVHFIMPMIDNVELFDLRDHLYNGSLPADGAKATMPKTALEVQSREGLDIGLGVTVRYRLDPNKLSSCASAFAPASRQADCSAGGRQRLARACPSIHGARDLLKQTRRSPREGSRHHHAQAVGRRHRC